MLLFLHNFSFYPHNKKIVTFYVGKRDEDSFIKFFGSLPIAKKYYSDDYKVYWENINEKKLKNGKFKEVNRNEALHSWLRAKNARLIRKTKAYSKSLNMLKYSLAISLYYGGKSNEFVRF